MKNEAKKFIDSNLNSEICKSIFNQPGFQDHFHDLFYKIIDFAFLKEPLANVCDQVDRIPEPGEFQLWDVPHNLRSFSSVDNSCDVNHSMLFQGNYWVPAEDGLFWMKFNFGTQIFVNAIALFSTES